MAKYASGKYAIGLCDICGFQCKLTELKRPTVMGRPTGVLSCPVCFDPDHPQNFLGLQKPDDPQGLRSPRPDPALSAIRGVIVSVASLMPSGSTGAGMAVGLVTIV